VSYSPFLIVSSIYNFAIANEELQGKTTEANYSCCGKSICKGCIHSFHVSGNIGKCPFCNSNLAEKNRWRAIRRFDEAGGGK
jgi:hypothetical protein